MRIGREWSGSGWKPGGGERGFHCLPSEFQLYRGQGYWSGTVVMEAQPVVFGARARSWKITNMEKYVLWMFYVGFYTPSFSRVCAHTWQCRHTHVQECYYVSFHLVTAVSLLPFAPALFTSALVAPKLKGSVPASCLALGVLGLQMRITTSSFKCFISCI